MTPAPEPPLADQPVSPASAVEIRGLTKSYSGTLAVDNLSVAVKRGEFFGFLGPNGAGKTTTIKMLMGLVQPDSGSMSIMGLRLPEQSLAARQQLGLVPDDSLLFDYLTGFEYLELIGRLYGLPASVARERGAELLELFELAAERKKLIGEYSKGMRKRVAFASALIHKPNLFLLDEPFEGVDAVGARLMKDILLDQTRRGATVFLTSHVLEVVERLCPQVAIISSGRIVAQGSLDELRGQAAAGATSLEDIFVQLVHAERYSGTLGWL